jgi:hypothetical protein
MTKLIIKRTSEWNNLIRNIGIYLDGKKIGVIGNGQTKEFSIEPGKHQLQTKIDWCGSEVLTFKVSETKNQKVKLSGFKHGNWTVPLTVSLIVLYFIFGQRLNVNPIYFLILMVPFLCYIFYYLTFGRNKYLRLKKI